MDAQARRGVLLDHMGLRNPRFVAEQGDEPPDAGVRGVRRAGQEDRKVEFHRVGHVGAPGEGGIGSEARLVQGGGRSDAVGGACALL